MEMFEDLKWGIDDDLWIENGDFGVVSGSDAIIQDIIHRLRCVKESDVFHQDYGTDWLFLKQSSYPDKKKLLEYLIRAALRTNKRIKQVVNVEVREYDPTTRTAYVNLAVEVDEKILEFSTTIRPNL